MHWFNNLPIKWKLNILIMITSIVGLTILGTSYFHMYRRQSWGGTFVEVQKTARLLATSTDSALAFNDQLAARLLLEALSADQEIHYVSISDQDGRLFAEYRRENSQCYFSGKGLFPTGGGQDEVGTLIHSFNTMVSEIQRRDESLEDLVAERTGELLQANEELRREMQERIKAERMIFASLREKEVHHRVKNNLSVISSLLGLQAEGVQTEPLRDALETCKQRIRTIASIHSMLYASDNLARIDFGGYLNKLTISLKNSYAASPGAPEVVVQL